MNKTNNLTYAKLHPFGIAYKYTTMKQTTRKATSQHHHQQINTTPTDIATLQVRPMWPQNKSTTADVVLQNTVATGSNKQTCNKPGNLQSNKAGDQESMKPTNQQGNKLTLQLATRVEKKLPNRPKNNQTSTLNQPKLLQLCFFGQFHVIEYV